MPLVMVLFGGAVLALAWWSQRGGGSISEALKHSRGRGLGVAGGGVAFTRVARGDTTSGAEGLDHDTERVDTGDDEAAGDDGAAASLTTPHAMTKPLNAALD